MRILIKGGVWKNTEDEILKAAVMKYGKNQWARIASLLNRKSAKQCKARWYEWLDPSIKKTDWNKEEEEKLLHLAKLMPNQWRTIAPIVGRTAAQCMEHYERLLDQAQESNQDGGVGDDVRKLKPGEIDPAPETKPARPDPIDMDEDEKEMLSEARARLANTKGKKAKRKARERQLEESRRLSMLQKRRELKAAGVESKLGSGMSGKRKYIDYAKEIPFQMIPPAGFYDVGDEVEKSKQMKFDATQHGIDLTRLEGRQQREDELKDKAKDEKKLKALFKANAPLAILSLSQANDPTSLRRRTALSLPSPQVSDAELEDIVKVGQHTLMPPPEGTMSATQSLIGNYSTVGITNNEQTPNTNLIQRTPLRENIILQEAKNQRILREMTPFTTAESDDIELPELSEGTGFNGITPRSNRLATPNVVLQKSLVPGTPLTSSNNSVVSSTASVSGSNRSHPTPIRDLFGLNSTNNSNLTKGLMSNTPLNRLNNNNNNNNNNSNNFDDDDSYSVSELESVSSSRISEKQKVRQQRAILAAKLGSLPEPEYTYEVVIPEIENEDDIDPMKNKPEDKAEIQLRLQKERELNEQKELLRRSQVIQRELPRPSSINYNLAKGFYDESTTTLSELITASSLIGQEMVQLLGHDDYKYINISENIKRKQKPVPIDLEVIDDKYLELAKKTIQEEYSSNIIYKYQVNDPIEFGKKSEEIFKQKIFIPAVSGSGSGKYISVNEASKNELLSSLTFQHTTLKSKIQKDMKKSSKLENKINVMTQGYSVISDKLNTHLKNSYEGYYKAAIEYGSLKDLYECESRSLTRRVTLTKEALKNSEETESLLQQRYATLRAEYESLLSH